MGTTPASTTWTAPWFWNTDMGVFKNVPFTKDGKRYVQFRIEFYNINEPTNWGGVNWYRCSSARWGAGGSTGKHHQPAQYLLPGRHHTKRRTFRSRRRANSRRRPHRRNVVEGLLLGVERTVRH